MARAKNQARRSGRSSGTPGWMWLLAGLMIGALAFGYLQFKDKWGKPASTLPQPDPQAQARAEAAAAQQRALEAERQAAQGDTATGDALGGLDQDAAAAPATPVAPAPVGPVPPVATTASEGPHYVIQAGAFLGSNEAEALKAKIALAGEVARVEIAQINGNTVHRVRMGPYPNAASLAAAKSALAAHGITAQAIRVK
jgi:cell division protein FtsN